MLLQMLEPAVRPVNAPKGAPTRSSQPPFESRSFESLLHEAQQTGTNPVLSKSGQDAPAGPQVAEATKPVDVLGPLSGLGTIENAALRQMMAQQAAPASAKGV